MKKTVLALSLLLSASTTTHAGWVDDWLDQSTTTGAGYFEGQQRGYYSGGSFNGRWHSTASYPVTLEAPRVRSGCGGIDVFLGGFSFMNSDYLVDKLQSILDGAAAVAFDLALKTLCEQCSNTIKNLEAISDKLNSMQIDECAAAKELVGIVADENGFHSTEVMQERLGTAIKENKLVSGSSEMWDILTKEDRANNNQVNASDVSDVTSGCNADIKTIFLNGSSMLDNVGSRLSIPEPHISLIRGLVGDLQLEGPANAYKITYMPPCSENNPDSIKSFASGEIYAKSTAGTCSQISDSNRDLVAYVRTALDNIYAKLESKAILTAAEQDFLDNNPLSALPILKTAVATNTKDSVMEGLSNISARAYSLQLLSDLYIRAEVIARKAKELIDKNAVAAGGQGPEKCAAVVFAMDANQNISQMLGKISELKEAARSSYEASAQEMNTIMDYLSHMRAVERQMEAEVTKRYGKDMAARVL